MLNFDISKVAYWNLYMGFQIHSAFHYKELALALNWVCTKKPSTGVTEDYQYLFRTDSILHSKNKSGNLEFFSRKGAHRLKESIRKH